MNGDKGQTRDNVPTCPRTKGQGTNWGQIGDIVPGRGQGTLGPLYIGGRLSPSLPARVTTSGDTRTQHSATHSPDSTPPRHMAPARALRPANALRFGPAAKKGKSSLPACVGCLLAIGWGKKRIARHTGFAVTSIHRWAKFNGVDLGATYAAKKQAECAMRTRIAKQSGWIMGQQYPRITKQARAKLSKGDAAIRRKLLRHENAFARIARNLRDKVRIGLWRKPGFAISLSGCTTEQLRAHLERQFYTRMSWANYGRAWHIDHIVPCSAFDLTNPEQQRQCFHFSNLRPLWARANLRKSDKITDPQFNLMLPAA